MKQLFVNTKQGDRLLLNPAHIVSIRKLKAGCEIHVVTGLVFEVEDELSAISEVLRVPVYHPD